MDEETTISLELAEIFSLEYNPELKAKKWWHFHPKSDRYFIEEENFTYGKSYPIYPAYNILELTELMVELKLNKNSGIINTFDSYNSNISALSRVLTTELNSY